MRVKLKLHELREMSDEVLENLPFVNLEDCRLYPERDREITRRVISGESLVALANDHDLGKERISQIVQKVVARAGF
jgi:hypothetical protein